MSDPDTMSELMAEARDMLFSLASVTEESPVLTATMGWAAAMLGVAAMASREEVPAHTEFMGGLRETLLVPEGVGDAEVAATVVSEIVTQRMAVSEYATRIESALKRHESDESGPYDVCKTCKVAAPCPTRTSLEG